MMRWFRRKPKDTAVRVFVYGTLKRGYGNWSHYLDREGVTFEGADVVRGFTLYDYGFPAAYPQDGELVEGEVFRIDPTVERDVMRRLDGLEGVPHMYTREPVVTVGGRTVQMYVWASEPTTRWIGESWPPADSVRRWNRVAR